MTIDARDPWIRLTFYMALVLGLVMATFTAVRLVGSGSLLTAPRHLSRAAGTPVGCTGDESLRSVLWESRLVLPCLPSGEHPAGGFVRLAPAEGTAGLVWPLPEELPLTRTEGVLAGPGDRLAIVYRTARGGLAAGVAGPNAWQRPPERLPLPDEAVLLGMAWVDDRLEVTATGSTQGPVPEGWNGPHIASLPPSGLLEVRELRPERLCDPAWLRCGVQAGLRQPGARVWRFLVAAGDPPSLWTVVENGVRHELQGIEFPWDAREDVDLTVAGLVIASPLRLAAVWTVDGELVPLTPADRAAFAGWSRDYRSGPEERLARRRHFSVGDASVMLEPDDAPTVGIERDTAQPRVLEAYRLVSPHLRAEGTVARLTDDCVDLTQGILVEREDGGFWAVSPGGCIVEVAPDASRADPLSLLEHLRQRGSTCSQCNAWYMPWLLGFMLLGLPLTLGLGWAFTARIRGRERRKAVEPLVMAAAALAYDVLAAVLLTQLLPALGY